MLKYEWDEDEARQAIREVGFEDGYDKGYDSGLMSAINSLMKKQNLTPLQAMDTLDIPVDAQRSYLSLLQTT